MKLTRGVSLMQQPLFVRLRERFIQYPIELGRLQSITIHNAQSEFTQGGTIITAYRASAHLTGNRRPILFHLKRTVSWLISMTRSNCRSSMLRSNSGKLSYIITTRRITSGDELK